jgi:hypothetical protein
VLLTTFFCGESNLLGLPIDVRNRQCPEWHQIGSGYELGKKRWQKFPVPAQKVNQRGCHTEVEYVIRGRQSAFDEQGKDDDLERVRNDGQHHGGLKARTRGDCDGVVSHGGDFRLAPFILNDAPTARVRIPIGTPGVSQTLVGGVSSAGMAKPILFPVTTRKRGNPNWGRPCAPIPALPTEFEIRVSELGLTNETYSGSAELRIWCERNRNRCYVPEWLLDEWDLQVDPNFAA